ncbi:glyoxylate/hydroxypyruvate reductase A [Ferrovibrio sp.]|uniref:2-hydroxyacid dehydrogenase n=1 Tax=Ferrovibrio sp. TaxID=1917215 RepID=UPI000CACEC83|nr:glyoxylate/hydroxypyruvate reductase A [Ferrovibrio sp.]PJI40888.1 MAG: glyoxylate/hydroxypyruvate reductase A [Ferrovibrio sp.]
MKSGRPVLLFACFGVDPTPWQQGIQSQVPELEIRLWPDAGDLSEIDYVLSWRCPHGFFPQFPALRAIFSMGAGIDRFLEDSALPPDIPLVRMVDPSLVDGMVEFVVMEVLCHHRRMPEYRRQQQRSDWLPLIPPLAQDRPVGIMGLGQLGGSCARALQALKFPVNGWARSSKDIPGIRCFSGTAAFDDFLKSSDIVVCLLPLTDDTRDILNARAFRMMRPGSSVINVARGGHLVEDDLIAAIDSGHLAGATLDVFKEEPLPAANPIWKHEKITVVPHASALTQPKTAALVVADNIRRHLSGQLMLNVVDKSTGY